jgi:predicted O-methyltransferase YrrM
MNIALRRTIKTIVRRPALSAVSEALRIPSGQISLEEARLLGRLLQRVDASRPIVEIGTLFGWSTRVIVMFKPAAMELITVDRYCWNPLGLSSARHFAITAEILDESKQTFNVKQINED